MCVLRVCFKGVLEWTMDLKGCVSMDCGCKGVLKGCVRVDYGCKGCVSMDCGCKGVLGWTVDVRVC